MTHTTDHRLEPADSLKESSQPGRPAPSTDASSDPKAGLGSRLATQFRSITEGLSGFARTKIAPVFNRGGAKAAERGRKGLDLSLTVAREQALPWLGRFGASVRQHTRPSVIKRDYRNALLLIHRKFFDRQIEELTFVSSNTETPLNELKIGSITRLSGRDYKPTPRLVFRWAMEAIPEKPENYTFIDFGAGRGRALLMASHLNFAKIIGVEFAEELHNDCEMNIAQYPRSLMKCRDIECVLQDATHFELPDSSTIFYFFHPFDDSIMAEVLDRIARSYDRSPRRIYLVCIDMPDSSAIDNLGIFRRFPLPGLQGMKVSLMSPYAINIYRTAT